MFNRKPKSLHHLSFNIPHFLQVFQGSGIEKMEDNLTSLTPNKLLIQIKDRILGEIFIEVDPQQQLRQMRRRLMDASIGENLKQQRSLFLEIPRILQSFRLLLLLPMVPAHFDELAEVGADLQALVENAEHFGHRYERLFQHFDQEVVQRYVDGLEVLRFLDFVK